MISKLKTHILMATLAGGMFAATAATAATVTVSYQESSIFGTPDQSSLVLFATPTTLGLANAGPFRLNAGAGLGNFVAFCVDLSKSMASGHTYETSAASAHGAQVDNAIDRLFTSAYAGINSAVKGAAFQVALWEIITDTGNGAYSLASGNFRALSYQNVMQQANSYLAALSGAGTGGYDLTFLNSDTSQNLVTATPSPVPVPAAAGMLGLGMLSFFGLRRRKKS
ncbi:MAG: PEP-CTERM sorting domain-containing protein [Paracoccaceae bacterium]